MKIIHVMGMESSKYGALERYNVELAKFCAERGDSIVFVYEENPDSDDFVQDLQSNGGKIVIINSRQNIFAFLNKYFKLCIHMEPNIVHTHFLNARYLAILVSFFFRKQKIFQTIHSGIRPNAYSWKTRLVMNLIFKSKVKSFTVSDGVRKQLLERHRIPENKVTTLHLGVSSFKYEKEILLREYPFLENPLNIISISNFNLIKGLDVLVKAISLLNESGSMSGCKLIIVGQPQEEIIELNKMIYEYNVENCILLLGIRNDIPKLLSLCDIYCQPSRMEGLSLAIMEALVAGLPIIATHVGGIPEAVENGYNGYLVEKESSNELAKKLGLLIKRKDLRISLGNCSKIKSQEFTIKKSVEALHERYKQ